MQEAPYRLLPLRRRHGSVWAEAVVDAEDYDRLAQWRWCNRSGRIGRAIRRDGRERGHLLAWEVLGITAGRVRFLNEDRLDHRKANLAMRPTPEIDGDIAWLPLCTRRNEVRAWAAVDTADLPDLGRYEWSMTRGDRTHYAARNGLADYGAPIVGLHRHIMGLTKGDKRQVDHINGNGLDNRRCNLRIVAGARENMQAVKRGRYRNVSWSPRVRAWIVQVKIGGRNVFIGSYLDREVAAEVAIGVRKIAAPLSLPVPFESAAPLPPAPPQGRAIPGLLRHAGVLALASRGPGRPRPMSQD